MVIVKSEKELEIMDEANRIVKEIQNKLIDSIEPGKTTTQDLEDMCQREIEKSGAEPAFQGYRGFPNTLCVSLNEEIVHGMGDSERVIKDGDILSLDLGVIWKGYYGDSALTVPIGSVPFETRDLIEVTRNALDVGAGELYEGNSLGNVSYNIQKFVEDKGYSVIRDFVGHGIGSSLHEDPQVPNYGEPDTGIELRKGIVLALEPMVSSGDYQVDVAEDGWTASTRDNSLSAHFEDSVAVSENGPRILGES